jgi:sugar lactone lactonase YvrE
LSGGTISNERWLIKFSDQQGLPDGAHIDSKDHIWVAMAGGESSVIVIDPTNRGEGDGKVINTLSLNQSRMAVSLDLFR